MELLELKKLYPAKVDKIDENIAAGFTPDQIFQFAIDKGDIPPILNRLAETYGEEIRPKLYENIKAGFNPLELAQSLSKAKKPVGIPQETLPRPTLSIENQFANLPVTAPEFAQPIQTPSVGQALPIPADKFSLVRQPAQQGRILSPNAIKSIDPNYHPVSEPPKLTAGLGTGMEVPIPSPTMPEGIYQEISPTGKAVFDLAGTFAPMIGAGAVANVGIRALSYAKNLVQAEKIVLDLLGGGLVYGAGKKAIEGKGPLETLAGGAREAGTWMAWGGVPIVGILGTKMGIEKALASNIIKEPILKEYFNKIGLFKAATLKMAGKTEEANALLGKAIKHETGPAPTLLDEPISELYARTVDDMATSMKEGKIKDFSISDSLSKSSRGIDKPPMPEIPVKTEPPQVAKEKLPSYEANSAAFDTELSKGIINDASSPNSINNAIAENMAEVVPDIKSAVANEGGFIETKAKKPIFDRFGNAENTANPSMDSYYKLNRPSWITEIKDKVSKYKTSIAQRYIYESAIKHDPFLYNEVRLIKDARNDALYTSQKALLSILAPFKEPDEYELFRRIFIARDLKNDITKGFPTALEDEILKQTGKQPTQSEMVSFVDNKSKELWKLADERPGLRTKIVQALVRHDRLHQKIGFDLEARGILPEGTVMANPQYFRHDITDYMVGKEDWHTGLSKKMEISYRPYTKAKKGTVLPIDYDYARVESKYLTQVLMNNAQDDFVRNMESKYNILPFMTPEEKIDKFLHSEADKLAYANLAPDDPAWRNLKPELKRHYTVGGEKYIGWQPDTGNYFYKSKTAPEYLMNQLLADEIEPIEFAARMKEGLLLGGKKPVSLVPEYVATKLNNFKNNPYPSELAKSIYNATTTWKRLILDLSLAPYQMNNFLGDMEALYRDNALAMLDPKAWNKAIRGSILSARGVRSAEDVISKFDKFIAGNKDMADTINFVRKGIENRVLSSGQYTGTGELGIGWMSSTRLKQLTGSNIGGESKFLDKIPVVGKGLNFIEFLSNIRENIPRALDYAHNMNLIDAGKRAVIPDWINVKGLAPESAVAMANRIKFVDYNASTPQFAQDFSGFLFPFARFYVKNTPNWARYIANPINQLAHGNMEEAVKAGGDMIKFLFPMGVMQVWNNMGDRAEIERLLHKEAPYIADAPHIITGWVDKSGKGTVKTDELSRALVVGFQDPLSMALRAMGGISHVPDIITRFMKKDITARQAGRELFEGLAEPFKQAYVLLNPMVKFPFEAAFNYDAFKMMPINKDVESLGMIGKFGEPDYYKSLVMQLFKEVFVPYATWVRTAKSRELSPVGTTGGPIQERLARTGMSLINPNLARKVDIRYLKSKELDEESRQARGEAKYQEIKLEKYMADLIGKNIAKETITKPLTIMTKLPNGQMGWTINPEVIKNVFPPETLSAIQGKVQESIKKSEFDPTRAVLLRSYNPNTGKYEQLIPSEVVGDVYFNKLSQSEVIKIFSMALNARQESLGGDALSKQKKLELYNAQDLIRKLIRLDSAKKLPKLNKPDAIMNIMDSIDFANRYPAQTGEE